MKRISILAGCLLLASVTGTSAASDKVTDCERYGLAFLKKVGASVSKIEIDRGPSFYDNIYNAKVGSQFVSSEYFGIATVTSPEGVKKEHFVCLHAGDGKQPVYFGLVPE